MKKTYKYVIMIFLICTTVFTGCASTNVGTDVEIKGNGSTESKIQVSYDSSISNLIGKGILEAAMGDEFVVSKYNEGNKVVEETQYLTDPLDLKTRFAIIFGSAFMKDRSFDNEYVSVKLVRNPGLLRDNYTVTITPKRDYYQIISDTVDEQISNIGSGSIISYIGGNVKSSIGSIPYTIKLKIPFKITGSNGNSGDDAKTVVWNTTLQNLNENNKLEFEFQAYNMVRVSAIILIAVIVIIAALIIKKKKKAK